MRVTVVGLGYVGLVTAACLAERGHDVTGFDRDPARLRALEAGQAPFFEPGLKDLVDRNLGQGRLRFTPNGDLAVSSAEIAIIAVGTDDGHGCWQTRTVLSAIGDVAPNIADDGIVVVRSTLPPDFVRSLGMLVNARREELGLAAVPVLLNPEFTREGEAIRQCLEPDRVLIGVAADPDGRGVAALQRLYHWVSCPVRVMTAVNACLAKLGANLFLATKISFANELAVLCDTFGAEVDVVVGGMADDVRIGSSFLRAGVGFGGSCLPHQVTSVVRLADAAGFPTPLLAAVDDINHRQRRWFVERLETQLGGTFANRRIALLGLAFKPNTDDLREAPSLEIAAMLIERGATVIAHDPMADAREGARARVAGLRTGESIAEALEDADALGLVTEWPEYRDLDWAWVARRMRGRIVVDGRNVLPRTAIRDAGFTYSSFGLGTWTPEAEGPTTAERDRVPVTLAVGAALSVAGRAMRAE